MSSIIKLALEEANGSEKTNDELVLEYIANNFPSVIVNSNNKTEIDLEDTVELSDEVFAKFKTIFKTKRFKILEPVTLKAIYNIIDQGFQVTKIQAATKNLRPVRYTWEQVEEENTILKNIWTSEFAPNYLNEETQIVGGVEFDKKTLSKAFQVHTILLSENKSISSQFFQNPEIVN
jgi:hypothetical protein